MVVAAIGIVINALTAWLFASGRKDDLNLRGAFLHMAADALRLRRRRRRGPRDPADGLAVARPARQPCDQRRDRLGNMGTAAGFVRHVDGGRARAIDPARLRDFLAQRGRASQLSTTCMSGR